VEVFSLVFGIKDTTAQVAPPISTQNAAPLKIPQKYHGLQPCMTLASCAAANPSCLGFIRVPSVTMVIVQIVYLLHIG
jgi:hypothetical protein